MLHGVNPAKNILLSILNIDTPESEYSSGRFRDIYVNEDGTKIILFTRNGGGNREEYQPIIDKLAEHPNYLTDYDDDYDCTYAYIEFSVPEKAQELCKGMATGITPKSLFEKTQEVLSQMNNMTKEQFREDPRFKPLADMLDKISEDIK